MNAFSYPLVFKHQLRTLLQSVTGPCQTCGWPESLGDRRDIVASRHWHCPTMREFHAKVPPSLVEGLLDEVESLQEQRAELQRGLRELRDSMAAITAWAIEQGEAMDTWPDEVQEARAIVEAYEPDGWPGGGR